MLFSIHPFHLLGATHAILTPRKAGLTPLISHQDRTAGMQCVSISFTTPVQVPPKQGCILKIKGPAPEQGHTRISFLGKHVTENKGMRVIRKNACADWRPGTHKTALSGTATTCSFTHALGIYGGPTLLPALSMQRQIMSILLSGAQSVRTDRYKNRPGQDTVASARRKMSIGYHWVTEERHATKTMRWSKAFLIQPRSLLIQPCTFLRLSLIRCPGSRHYHTPQSTSKEGVVQGL